MEEGKGGASFEVFFGEDGEWYWHLLAANGQVIAIGGEGYESKGNALRALGTVKRTVLELVGERIESVHADDAAKADVEIAEKEAAHH